jgi:formate dehydrogenase subunit delta
MSPDKMVHMANQIAGFFKTQPGTDQAERVAGHLSDFWEPRMRSQLLAYVRDGGKGLDVCVLDAVRLLPTPQDS